MRDSSVNKCNKLHSQREAEEGEDSESESDSSDDDELEGVASSKSKKKKANMPRIQANERVCVENWLQKWRKDGLMLNARWIRNGGAKGVSMTVS